MNEKIPAPLNNATRSMRLTFLVLWFVIFALFSQVHQRKMDPMTLTRLDLLHALVYQHTFAIDIYHTNTPDLAFVNGHYYCDKAPGLALVTLPEFYLASKILETSGMPADSGKAWFWSNWITVAISIGAFSALGIAFLFLWLQGFIPPRIALLCSLVVAFGSAMFPYATMMFSHGLVVGFLCMALWLLSLGHEPDQSPSNGARHWFWRDLAGGAACGMAIACEYDAALVTGGMLAVILASSFRRSCRLALGAVPPLLLIPFYNWVCMGNPFSLPYGHEVVFTQMHNGFYGIHLPDADNFAHLLFSPERGLFFWTPFLLLAFPGYYFIFKKSRSLFWLCYWVPLLHVMILSGYYTREAGNTLGARLLAPILPLLILPAGMAAARARWAAIPLAIFSIASMGGATLINSQLPQVLDNPLFDDYIPELLKGNFTLTLGEVMGLSPPWSILPLVIVIIPGMVYVWRQAGKASPPNLRCHDEQRICNKSDQTNL
jgi:hypothetical protein